MANNCMPAGLLISIEGGEGGGKSTQLRKLAQFLRDIDFHTITTREPGGSQGAEEIRTLLVTGEPGRWTAMTEALLHMAARCDHLDKTVYPALAQNAIVLSDRFFDSTFAYQGYGHGLSVATLRKMQEAAIGTFKPHMTLLLDLPPSLGLQRACDRHGGEDRYEKMDIGFHRKLRDGFLLMAHADPTRYCVIDAAADADNVFADILYHVISFLHQRLRPQAHAEQKAVFEENVSHVLDTIPHGDHVRTLLERTGSLFVNSQSVYSSRRKARLAAE